jgi:hypothetical protein
MHSVLLTQTFLSDAKRAGLDDDGILEIATNISREPHQGDVIPGTGGARKRRLSGKGKGKSGGFRVISYFASDDVPIILLALIDKGERADISPSDRIAIKDLLGRFADEYRRGVIRSIHSRQRIETE